MSVKLPNAGAMIIKAINENPSLFPGQLSDTMPVLMKLMTTYKDQCIDFFVNGGKVSETSLFDSIVEMTQEYNKGLLKKPTI